MRKASAPTRCRSVASFLGLVTASLVCLCGGALVAVSYEGMLRLIFAGAGFSGYLFFFAHALKELGLPSTISGDAPDGEVRQQPVLRPKRKAAGRNHDITLAA